MKALTSSKLRTIGDDHTAKNIFRLPVMPKVFIKSEIKWYITPIIMPRRIFIIFFFILSFLIDKRQPNNTIAIRIKGYEKI